jgi:iron(III) transport system substrate-binding protein
MKRFGFLAAAVLFSVPARASEVWVYTSIYKEFAQPLKEAFEKSHPGVTAQIYQAGSEKIQAKVEAELLAKRPQADIILSSDPFWALDLEKRGLAFARPGHAAVETNYNSLMVMIAHKDFPAAKRPATFKDLAKPELKGIVQLGSPLESGTAFTIVAYLSRKYGWDYFQQLRGNGVAAAGGNSTVVQKVESGEKKIGVVLLENALAAQKRGSPIEVIYPADGSVPIPSVQVILQGAANQAAAAQFADFVLSEAGQKVLRGGFMYAVNPRVPAPEGAPALAEVSAKATPWTPDNQREVAAAAKDIKKKFAALILE